MLKELKRRAIRAPLASRLFGGTQAKHAVVDIAAFWRHSAAELMQRIAANDNGLSAAEAATRLRDYGPNTIEDRRTFVAARKLLRRFTEPLILILIAAAIVSVWAEDTASFWIISATVTISIILDFVQEYRAERAAEALQRSVAIHADVHRDGILRSLPAADIVPGDIVELRAGDLVPGDGVLLKAHDLFAREAVLTGEPYPYALTYTVVQIV